jgi:hypothetical protein
MAWGFQDAATCVCVYVCVCVCVCFFCGHHYFPFPIINDFYIFNGARLELLFAVTQTDNLLLLPLELQQTTV